ncbi:MAG: HAMP domain-containing sensor histidine kinase [Thermoplasmata archaeon]
MGRESSGTGMRETVRSWETPSLSQGSVKILPVEDVLDILRLILRVEPLDVLLQKIVDTISDAFGMKRVSLGVFDEKTGLFCPRAFHGYPPENVIAIKKHAYTLERMKTDLRPELKIGRSSYYVRAEDQDIAYNDETDYVMNAELVDAVRNSPSDWHELDYIDFVMTDRLGNWIGWIGIDEPSDRMVPSKDVVDRVQILTDLAAIAIENAKTYEEAVNAMNDSQGYLDLIVHDIGNLVSPMLYYLNTITSSDLPEERRLGNAKNAVSVGESIRSLVDNVRKFSEVRASESLPQERYSLKEVIQECIPALRRSHPTKNVIVNIDCPEPASPILADVLIHDLFMNILSNAVKYSHGPTAEIDVKIIEGYSAMTIRIEDHGRGIPDSKKGQVFSRFAKRPEGFQGTGLGLSIVSLLVERYNGLITVEDRISGDCSQGACFQASFPKLLAADNRSPSK